MPQGTHFPNLCPPGTRMLLEVTGVPEKLTAACVGHQRGRFLVTSMPLVPENSREATHQMFYPDNTVIVRFLLEGTVVGFSAKLIKALQIPFPLLFLTYPRRFESHDLRRHRRVPCCIPAETDLGQAPTQGMIMDLSLTGCQFSTSLASSQPPRVRVDDQVILRCDLFSHSGQFLLPGAVKRVGISEKRLDIGLKFTDVPQDIRTALDGYIHHALSVLD